MGALLTLGGRIRSGSDGDAARTGFLFFAAWTYLLRNAGGAMSGQLVTLASIINPIMAISMARRQGGLWQTATSLDTASLDSVLPRSDDINLRNIVGVQCLFWGLMGLFQQDFLFTSIMGATAAGRNGVMIPVVCSAILAKGLALHNILLAGSVFGSKSDDDAANTGVVFFGAWSLLMLLAKNAGTVSGPFIVPILLWNLGMTAYCFKKSS